jgi:hypothetical protein
MAKKDIFLVPTSAAQVEACGARGNFTETWVAALKLTPNAPNRLFGPEER